MQLINKKILITGATSGIGLKLVEKLYQHNSLYIIARSQDKINDLIDKYPLVHAFKADLKNIDEVKSVAQEIKFEINALDVLINNAALQYTPMFIDDDFEFDSISEEININFTSVAGLCYLLMPLLNGQHPSVILNVNSGLGLVPKTTSAIYCASKGALNTFSQSLRYQLENTKVEVLQVFLPLVDTAMTAGRGKAVIPHQFFIFHELNFVI